MAGKTGRPRGRPKKDGTPPKPRNFNPVSRNNLMQYAGPKEQKKQEKILKSMVNDLGMDIPSEMLEVIIPTKKVFSKEEKTRFLQLLRFHLEELSDHGKITFPDVQAVAELCKNIIMEDRLLEDAQNKMKEDPTAIVNVMASIDKLKKRNKDLSDSLATNRNVRVDPRQSGNTTILDIIEDYERKGQAELQRKLRELKKEEDDEVPAGSYQTSVEEMIKGVVE